MPHKKIFSIIALTALLLSGCSGGGSSTAEESFVIGSGVQTFINKGSRVKAPELSGMTLTGVNYTREPGKVAVVNVWASWCSPCRAEAPTLVALSEKYPDVQFMGILTRDNLANAEVFAKQRGVQYPNFIDDSLILGFRNTLPANAIPTTVVIDQQGLVAARISGPVTVASLSDLIERLAAE